MRRSTVPVAGLKKHLERCPKAVQRRRQSKQPFYRTGCNDGSGDELDLGISGSEPAEHTEAVGDAAVHGNRDLTAASCPVPRHWRPPSGAVRAAYAARLGEAGLADLIARIRRAQSQESPSAAWLPWRA